MVIASDPEGESVIEPGTGTYHGDYSPGKAKYRFQKPGSYYGGPCYTVLFLKDGNRQPYYISDGALRHE